MTDIKKIREDLDTYSAVVTEGWTMQLYQLACDLLAEVDALQERCDALMEVVEGLRADTRADVKEITELKLKLSELEGGKNE